MGVVCTRDEVTKLTPLPDYETICSKIERRLVLPTLRIKDLEQEIYSIEKERHSFLSNDIIEIYGRHGVTRKEFLAPESIYQDLLPDLNDCAMCAQYFLSTALPFCKGSASEKKEVLWSVLEPEAEGIERKKLRRTVKMIIALSVKTVPDIALKELEEAAANKDLAMMVESEDENVKLCANQYYLKETKKYGNDGEGEIFMSRFDYDLWLIKIDSEKLFTSSGNREVYLNFLNSSSATNAN